MSKATAKDTEAAITKHAARIDAAWRKDGWNGRAPKIQKPIPSVVAELGGCLSPTQYAAIITIFLEDSGISEAREWAGMNRTALLDCFSKGKEMGDVAFFAESKLRPAARK